MAALRSDSAAALLRITDPVPAPEEYMRALVERVRALFSGLQDPSCVCAWREAIEHRLREDTA